MSKFYDKRTLNHEQAVAWMKQQILEMRFAFNETHTEAGIDAYVELADPQTGEALGSMLGVQVKTQTNFAAETDEKFSFYADGDDLNYWLSSQIPVLLLVCKARTSEAYAQFVHEYFNAAENRATKTIVFDKKHHRFEPGEAWQRRLLETAVPRSKGFAFPPSPAPEDVSSNLLEVHLPKTVYSGRTTFKKRHEIVNQLRDADFYESEFIIKEDFVWTVHRLYDAAWSKVVENGSIRHSPFHELAFHNDLSRRNYAKELLTQCLIARLRRDAVQWFRDEEMFIYYPHQEKARRVRKTVKKKQSETKIGLLHVTEYQGRTVRCRHAAMMAKFVEIGDKYFLQIDPTWCFTRDGERKHPRWEDLIRRIRIMQKERDYHSTLNLWREVLTEEADLIRQNYPFLSFGDFIRFEAPVSVADELWKATSDQEPQVDLEQSLLEFDK